DFYKRTYEHYLFSFFSCMLHPLSSTQSGSSAASDLYKSQIPLFTLTPRQFFYPHFILSTYKSKTRPAILYYGARRFPFTSP
ncbi:hypothetical protein PAS25_24125, partial [Leclercia adecarboxylata]|uniref:hypothetical protein n=1 Tax=Leclercia adecarboxylata TaxID=83655 RepID=UPI003133E5A2